MKKIHLIFTHLLTLLILGSVFSSPPTYAKKKKKSAAEEVNVDKIKKKYWARGNESEIGVVQNRIYSKANKYNLGVLGGVSFVDPFLSVKQYGGYFGYYFNETWGLHFNAWKYSVSGSTALNAVNSELNVTVNTNEPNFYYGFEGSASLIYGKLSLVGKSIIYYDLHMLGGIGLTRTQTGSYITPSLGFGQRFFLSRRFSLRLDYRLLFYRENVAETQITTQQGNTLFKRSTFSNNITLGVDFFF